VGATLGLGALGGRTRRHRQLPDVDALLVVTGRADAVNFLTQYEQAGGGKPMVGSSITVDQPC
jgi:hypothetical protein